MAPPDRLIVDDFRRRECVKDCDALRWRHLELEIWRQKMASRGVVRASKFRRVATPGAARALRFNNKPTRISGSGMEFSAGTNVVPSHWNANCQSVLERDDAERSVNLTGRWGALPRRRMPKQEIPKVFHEPSANTLDACVCACVMRPLHS